MSEEKDLCPINTISYGLVQFGNNGYEGCVWSLDQAQDLFSNVDNVIALCINRMKECFWASNMMEAERFFNK